MLVLELDPGISTTIHAYPFVMPGPAEGQVPAIHVFGAKKKDVDGRHKASHDEC